MPNSFPPPPIQPLEQLLVKDGLMINADKWQRAHTYHQQKQNTLFQSLHQPGIVVGLGIHLIPAPEDTAAQYRDQRWLEIQPGIAIDLSGNLIVVPEPIPFHIASGDTPNIQPMIVYLTISYVDPKTLVRREQAEVIKETFRIDEETSPPSDTAIEVCRIQIQPGAVVLQRPLEVLHPGTNQIDLRYRLSAKTRPQATAKIALIDQGLGINLGPYQENLSFLLEALDSLYPSLQGDSLMRFPLSYESVEDLRECNLIVIPGVQISNFENEHISLLRDYLSSGGMVLVEIKENEEPTLDTLKELAYGLGASLDPLHQLPRKHLLKTKPFLFSALPKLYGQEVQIFCGGSIIAVVGDLSSAWGASEAFGLTREEVRASHELGINILNYATRRKILCQLMN
jgi:Domain of unknown function (DUF4159)